MASRAALAVTPRLQLEQRRIAAARGDDPYGYRAEFVNLVRTAKAMTGDE